MLAITARLREGRYEAAGQRPDEAEWPPHPARLFCALVASATEDAHWEVLRWLEAAGAPEVWACARYTSSKRQGWVVTNATDSSAASQHRLGRTNGLRVRVTAEPADPEFAVVWPAAEALPGTVEAVRALARRVPYLGRSTSPVTLRVEDVAVRPRESWERFRPAQPGERAAVPLRVPYPGYTSRLREAYEEGSRAWEESSSIPYVRVEEEQIRDADAVASPFEELLVFPFERGTVKPSGDSLLALTSRLREAVMSRIGTNIPPQVSGHGSEDRRHLAYLALPDVGHEHASGRILGVALGIPADLPSDDYAVLWEAVVERPLDHLWLTRQTQVKLEHPLEFSPLQGVQPGRWTGGAGGSHGWTTVAPLMLDRFPKRRNGDEAVLRELAASVVRAGYPEPEKVEFAEAPMITGGLHRIPRRSFPEGRPMKPLVHARVTFAAPQVGPVLVGAFRYLGLGLLAPAKENP
ncbi:type I-U CRISPR-associated protein Csb2 [Actinocorallia sp. API 0066]|uniref:type I-G CRISPR-associated protein Csb2 n=1 Tax=Actinocorallia sp. API 0066 TaxID=2896846 RepID=UPI001E37FD50|nr:type I-U CRISPR-associated protein Csb2 [Actinocorallia sp. API 0066]MCD0449406.1 type I-U CRISPR-associated protein Csb2 [Actinocorallia sp. API 0066]